MITIITIILLVVGVTLMATKRFFSYDTRDTMGFAAGVSFFFAVLFLLIILAIITEGVDKAIEHKSNISRRQAVITHLDEQIKTGVVEKYYGKRERLEQIKLIEKDKAKIIMYSNAMRYFTLYRY